MFSMEVSLQLGETPTLAIDEPLKLKASIILENNTKLKDLKKFESARLLNSFRWLAEWKTGCGYWVYFCWWVVPQTNMISIFLKASERFWVFRHFRAVGMKTTKYWRKARPDRTIMPWLNVVSIPGEHRLVLERLASRLPTAGDCSRGRYLANKRNRYLRFGLLHPGWPALGKRE